MPTKFLFDHRYSEPWYGKGLAVESLDKDRSKTFCRLRKESRARELGLQF
ncbi:MAG TPA: hypothetical protein VFI70_01440 [Nitrososphaeraceae archaeon]|nr:hypothetical protein [Nitrososphaeraceae archaeon]